MQTCAVQCSAGLAPRPAAAGSRRPRAAVLVAAQQKGFSGGAGQKMPKQVKKSKRGKVASRPSPKLTLEQLQAEQAAYEDALRQQQQQPGAGASSAAAAAGAAGDEDDGAVSYGGGAAPSSGGGGGSRTVEYGSAAAVPEAVTNRMLRRVILFMGAPVFTGILLFPFFYWLKVKQDVDLPSWVPYLASSLTFGGGLLGISYGIMSASWDPRREGSLLGWTEFQANVPLLLDRFRRN
ncbi:hypothetical protein ABPG75_009403 [Micractinium tetrahymenae]